LKNINQYTEFNFDNPFGSQAKMLYHIDRLYSYLHYGDAWPIFIEINLTDKCNLSCSWCISGNRLNNTINTNQLMKFLKNFKEHGGKAVTFSGGGEPTLHPDFYEIVVYTKNLGFDLGLMTNGTFAKRYINLIGDNFKWVRFSLDTVNHEKYKEWKGINAVSRVLNNMRFLKDKNVKVGINCNVNIDMTINDIICLVDAVFLHCKYIQFRPVLPRYFKKEKPVLNLSVWAYLRKNFATNLKINFSFDKLKDVMTENWFPFETCEGHFFSPILNSDGNLMICMYHFGDNRFAFGNIYESTFEEIWNSNMRKKTIHFVRQLDYHSNCQVCCKLCELNKFIFFLTNPNNDMDINFL